MFFVEKNLLECGAIFKFFVREGLSATINSPKVDKGLEIVAC